MHDLIATTALGTSAPAVDHHGPVTLTEEPGIALASVAARRGESAQRPWPFAA
ncbi:hypothetical protein OAB19_07385 [Planktomarina temperata]|nr:hypothetical protein [Planktomarina temperata]